VQVFKNCNIFNDHAFDEFREKALRGDSLLELKHGEPMIFGKDRDRGIKLSGCYLPEVVQLGNGVTEDDLLRHDEQAPMSFAFMLSRMVPPHFPMPVGVIRRVAAPTYDAAVHEQIEAVRGQKGPGDLDALSALIRGGDTWTVS
jgi:2-oxoglutarate ferredoxin oxidoreductase subunit beta